MRRFRAIIESPKMPEDKEVLWYYKGKLLYYGSKAWQDFLPLKSSSIDYNTEEDESITNVKEALDKLLYVEPKILFFTLKQAGTYERGTILNILNFSWNYNKKLIKSQKINDIVIPTSIRTFISTNKVSENSSYILEASDGTNTVSILTSIKFVDYIYYGVLKEGSNHITKGKFNPSIGGLTVTANANEYIWIFIPNSSNFTKIWHNNVDSTEDFHSSKMTFPTDTGLNIEGIYYKSKNHSLNSVTLKFT